MAKPLDLVTTGGRQVESVRVWTGDPSTRAQNSVTSDFFSQLDQFNNRAGGLANNLLAARQTRQVEEEQKWATLKATNPVEWQKRLAAGEVKETDHAGFVQQFNAVDAQARVDEAKAEFSGFDVAHSDDATVAKFANDTVAKYSAHNPSLDYQAAVAAPLNNLRNNLFAARADALSQQHADMAYVNTAAALTGAVRDAASQGRLSEIGPTLDTQIARGVAHGLSVSRLVKDTEDSLVSAVSRDPHIADDLVGIKLPVLGGASVGDLMGDKLMDAQASAVAAQEREQRAARAERIAAEKEYVRGVENRAAQEQLSGNLSPETASELAKVSPAFITKLASINTAAETIMDASPGYQKLRSEVILGSRDDSSGGKVQQDTLDTLLDSGQIGPKQHIELSKLAADARSRRDVTKLPEYAASKTLVLGAFSATLKTLIPKKSDTGLPDEPTGLSTAATIDVEDARARVDDMFHSQVAERIASGVDPATAIDLSAKEAREQTVLELNTIAIQHGLGEHAEDAVTMGAAEVVRASRPPVSPQVIREANGFLDMKGIQTLDALGGFHTDQGVGVYEKTAEAMASLPTLTPWAKTAYGQFRAANPGVFVDPEQYLFALHYASMPGLGQKASAKSSPAMPTTSPRPAAATTNTPALSDLGGASTTTGGY